MNFSWMAWTPHTALFFLAIGLILLVMSIVEIVKPGGNPRKGVLGLNTTRGDRLFISLLAASYIHLGWIAWVGDGLYYASGLSLICAACVFKWV